MRLSSAALVVLAALAHLTLAAPRSPRAKAQDLAARNAAVRPGGVVPPSRRSSGSAAVQAAARRDLAGKAGRRAQNAKLKAKARRKRQFRNKEVTRDVVKKTDATKREAKVDRSQRGIRRGRAAEFAPDTKRRAELVMEEVLWF